MTCRLSWWLQTSMDLVMMSQNTWTRNILAHKDHQVKSCCFNMEVSSAVFMVFAARRSPSQPSMSVDLVTDEHCATRFKPIHWQKESSILSLCWCLLWSLYKLYKKYCIHICSRAFSSSCTCLYSVWEIQKQNLKVSCCALNKVTYYILCRYCFIFCVLVCENRIHT